MTYDHILQIIFCIISDLAKQLDCLNMTIVYQRCLLSLHVNRNTKAVPLKGENNLFHIQ